MTNIFNNYPQEESIFNQFVLEEVAYMCERTSILKHIFIILIYMIFSAAIILSASFSLVAEEIELLRFSHRDDHILAIISLNGDLEFVRTGEKAADYKLVKADGERLKFAGEERTFSLEEGESFSHSADNPYIQEEDNSGQSEMSSNNFHDLEIYLQKVEVDKENLRHGDRGPPVIFVQHILFQKGYLDEVPTGEFNRNMLAALRDFQEDYDLKSHGIVDDKTWAVIKGIDVPGVNPDKTFDPVPPEKLEESEIESKIRGNIEALEWGRVRNLFQVGDRAEIIDIETEKSFAVKRTMGYLHADVEPLDTEDTEKMLEIFGGSWSWERRPVIVELDDRFIAGSINGMPHGEQVIRDNNFPGHFCLHFEDSRLHKNEKMDKMHQENVEKIKDHFIDRQRSVQ